MSTDLLSPIPLPAWLLILLIFGFFLALLWAVLPLLQRKLPARWPFDNADANVALSLVIVIGGLLFVGAIITGFAVLWHTVTHALDPAQPGISLGAGSLVAALLGAPFLIWGTILRHRTTRTQQEGHMTDRINKAVEMLGAEKTVKEVVEGDDGQVVQVERSVPNLEVRIGAILSLERIAQDSTKFDKGRDHVRVMEILCAYIRQNAPASSAEDHPYGDWVPLYDNLTRGNNLTPIDYWAYLKKRDERFSSFWHDGKVGKWVQSLDLPRADIAEVIKVIGRRNHAQLLVEAAWPDPPHEDTVWPFDEECPALLDDMGDARGNARALAHLMDWLDDRKARIRAYSGYRMDLKRTNLRRANMIRGRFSAADLGESRLEGAHLFQAQLSWANLSKARLEGAYLAEARLQGTFFGDAKLEGASLREVELQGASFLSARLEKASLNKAKAHGAQFGNSRMEGADLDYAELQGGDFREASFDADTHLASANLRGAAFSDLNAFGVRFNLTQSKVIFGDATVILPDGLTAPSDWPVWRLPIFGAHNFDDEWRRWQREGDAYIPPDPPNSAG